MLSSAEKMKQRSREFLHLIHLASRPFLRWAAQSEVLKWQAWPMNACSKHVVISLAWGTNNGQGAEIRINNSFFPTRLFPHVEFSQLPTSWPEIVVFSSPFTQRDPEELQSQGKAYAIQSGKARESFARAPPSPN